MDLDGCLRTIQLLCLMCLEGSFVTGHKDLCLGIQAPRMTSSSLILDLYIYAVQDEQALGRNKADGKVRLAERLVLVLCLKQSSHRSWLH